MRDLLRVTPAAALPALLLAALVVSLLFPRIETHRAKAEHAPLTWIHLSSAYDDLPPPGASTEQTAALVLDIDGDGVNDFVIAARRTGGPSVVWYQRTDDGWTRHLIDPDVLEIEAGGAFYDIDGDGDLDIVFGGDHRSRQVWWWENPSPDFDRPAGWTRRIIKDSGSSKHHDVIFGDFDGDGQEELVFWNQGARTLWRTNIPTDPYTAEPWPLEAIFTWQDGDPFEGLAKADIDGDGVTDIIGGGRWFKHVGDGQFAWEIIDDAQRFTRAAAGQLVPGGRPEVVFGAGDLVGPLRWYEWTGDAWAAHDLLPVPIVHGHSLAIADLDLDGNLDIFAAEMRLNGSNPEAKAWIFLGDGQGNFVTTEVTTGYDHHESVIADLDGDGDLDILGKPYNYETPRLDIWLNGTICQPTTRRWQRRIIDPAAPHRLLFVLAGDLTGNGWLEVSAGGWWYQRPATPGAPWVRNAFDSRPNARFNNVAALYDFDRDGLLDAFGSRWQDRGPNPALVWARNEGGGNFAILENVTRGEGDFLQGVAIGPLTTGTAGVALSWHHSEGGVQLLTVPGDPVNATWPWRELSPASQFEALSAGDIDGDGDLDLLLGTQWLENPLPTGDPHGAWPAHTLHVTDAPPDRNRLADINGDGRLDAVVGYEAISTPGLVAWYEQPADPTQPWIEHIIGAVIGPMSLDVADMDGDGDLDVVVGEHNTKHPASASLFIFENVDGNGREWRQHLVYRGDEHHDGALVVDIDGNGDLDILSIGWTHRRVLLYENVEPQCLPPAPTPIPTEPDEPEEIQPATPTALSTQTGSATSIPTSTQTITPQTITPTHIPTGTPEEAGTPQRAEPTPTSPPITDGGPDQPDATPSLPAQDTGHVRGTIQIVIDDEVVPVQGTFRLLFRHPASLAVQFEFLIHTDASGAYYLPDLPVGHYVLTVLAADAALVTTPEQVIVTAGSTVEVLHHLEQSGGEYVTFLSMIQR
jgi:hypothetical protein